MPTHPFVQHLQRGCPRPPRDDRPLHVASGDLDNAFYRLRPMSGLEDYFALPMISSTLEGVTYIDGDGVPAGTPLFPCLTILPMGRSWAMRFCQAVTMRAISLAGFAESEIVEDGRCSAPLRAPSACAAAGYVDNF